MAKLYELGNLKNNPQQLYDIAIKFSQFYDGICPPTEGGEIWDVLSKVNLSLWAYLPPVITIDLSDPDEPHPLG